MDPPMLSHALPCSPDALSHHKTDGRKTLFMSILPALPDGRTDGPVVLFPPRSSVYCVQGVRNTTCLVGVTTLKTVHVVRTKCTGGPQQFACFVFFPFHYAVAITSTVSYYGRGYWSYGRRAIWHPLPLQRRDA